MSNKNAHRTVLAGLGVAAGATLAAAFGSLGTANAWGDTVDVTIQNNSTPYDIEGYSSRLYTDATVVDSSLVYIENDSGRTTTDITGGSTDTANTVYVENNTGPIDTDISSSADAAANRAFVSFNSGGATHTDITSSGADTLDRVSVGGDSDPTSTNITATGAGSTVFETVFNNTGQVDNTVNTSTPDSSSFTEYVGDSGRITNNINGGGEHTVDTWLNTNTQADVVNLNNDDSSSTTIQVGTSEWGNTGATDINVNPTDTAPIYVDVYSQVTGTVEANVNGVTTIIPAGEEVEILNGAVDVIGPL